MVCPEEILARGYPCAGHFQKLGRNRQRQKGAFWVVQIKKAIFWQRLVENPS